MNLRQSILDANQVRMDDQYRAYNKVLKGHALETTTVNDALAALTPDAAVALVSLYLWGRPDRGPSEATGARCQRQAVGTRINN